MWASGGWFLDCEAWRYGVHGRAVIDVAVIEEGLGNMWPTIVAVASGPIFI